jgi:tetratricopeptide (TPR) repeat protein
MNRIIKKLSKAINTCAVLRNFHLAYLSTRLILPIAIPGLMIMVFFFFIDPETRTSDSIQQNTLGETIENANNANSSDRGDFISDSANSVISYENIDSQKRLEEQSVLKSMGWSWIDPYDNKEVTWTAEQAYEEAKRYVEGEKPTQLEALKMYQRVLDANPPRSLALYVKMVMGCRMAILYNPEFNEDIMYDEALKWYKKIIYDYNDLGNHYDLMVAKIHLGDLYCMGDYGVAEAQKASELCMEIIEVPEDEIIFDEPRLSYLNMDRILKAEAPIGRVAGFDPNSEILAKLIEERNKGYRKTLLIQRESEINSLRTAAMRSLTYKQYVPGFPHEAYLKRLEILKQQRPDDKLYQESLDAKIKDVSESLENNRSKFDEVFEEGLKNDEAP